MTTELTNLAAALLGLLAQGPATGYDLSRRMDRRVRPFWEAQHSQIYPELGRLQAAGLVGHEVVTGAGPRPTKRYHLSPAGRARLVEWVTTPPGRQPDRDPLMLRVMSFWLADTSSARAVIEEVLQDHRARLADYLAQRDHFSHAPSRHDPTFGSWATLHAGISYERHRIRWCQWLLRELADRR